MLISASWCVVFQLDEFKAIHRLESLGLLKHLSLCSPYAISPAFASAGSGLPSVCVCVCVCVCVWEGERERWRERREGFYDLASAAWVRLHHFPCILLVEAVTTFCPGQEKTIQTQFLIQEYPCRILRKANRSYIYLHLCKSCDMG